MKKIKLQSRYQGEERIFCLTFSYFVIRNDTWTNLGTNCIIDDPVSSMDEHNIFTTAESCGGERYLSEKKIILTTHHIGSFSILTDRLKKRSKK
jgi:wobble nucleotide-excising tRNase